MTVGGRGWPRWHQCKTRASSVPQARISPIGGTGAGWPPRRRSNPIVRISAGSFDWGDPDVAFAMARVFTRPTQLRSSAALGHAVALVVGRRQPPPAGTPEGASSGPVTQLIPSRSGVAAWAAERARRNSIESRPTLGPMPALLALTFVAAGGDRVAEHVHRRVVALVAVRHLEFVDADSSRVDRGATRNRARTGVEARI
jgi:hypothetical protein